MGFRKLIEMTDKIAREELDDYYILSRSRMDNIIYCLESGAEQIKGLEQEVLQLNNQITELQARNNVLEEMVGDYQPYGYPDDCNNGGHRGGF